MKVTAIRNRYINIFGSKKLKVLTKGKQYEVVEDFSTIKMHCIIDDTGNYGMYNKSEFMKTSEVRNQKLEILGIKL